MLDALESCAPPDAYGPQDAHARIYPCDGCGVPALEGRGRDHVHRLRPLLGRPAPGGGAVVMWYLEFAFQTWWHFIGCVIILAVVLDGAADILNALARIVAATRTKARET
jgi:hypothetical protein